MLQQRRFFTRPPRPSREAGFTLVELLIAMVISGLVMSAVVAVHTTQTKSYVAQDSIAEIQQNLRGVLAILPAEIRLAGCDPTGEARAKIKRATATELHFTMDVRSDYNSNAPDGDTDDANEEISYTFNQATKTLGRQTGGAGGHQPLADSIDELEFNYLLKNGSFSPNPGDPDDIRAVQVSILGRTAVPDANFTHSGSYKTASGAEWTPPQDHFRRRLVITTIQCRNMGL